MMKTAYRTYTCNELTIDKIGEQVLLVGWASRIRDLGGVLFIDIRDRYGKTQIYFPPENQNVFIKGKQIKSEYVLQVSGTVKERPSVAKNSKVITGDIEVEVSDVIILNRSEVTPITVESDGSINEDLKLKYRYLDLRRKSTQDKILFRSKISHLIRMFMHNHQFAEIETPVLMKSTPEGARDFLVPSRLFPGQFYALPQSPQTFKQILMVSGFDRYFQIVKCFRDEDLRADRQPEFTQIDIEMSFVDENDVQTVAEGLVNYLFENGLNHKLNCPFKKLSYSDAMHVYGSDKPDLRNPLKIKSLHFETSTGFKVFDEPSGEEFGIAGIQLPSGLALSRKEQDQLIEKYKAKGLGGLIFLKMTTELEGSIIKYLNETAIQRVISTFEPENNSQIILSTGDTTTLYPILGELRTDLATKFDLIKKDTFEFCWVTDFPVFEWNIEDNRYYAMHHPFTSPKDEDMEMLGINNGAVRAKAYDLVLNGSEIAGGSIRIHNPHIQKKMFSALGINEEEANEKFGFLLDAFKYGAPPHGGIAFGLDRLLMIMTESSSIRDVIPFPKNSSAQSLMEGSPSVVSNDQLKELNLAVMINK